MDADSSLVCQMESRGFHSVVCYLCDIRREWRPSDKFQGLHKHLCQESEKV